MPGFSASLTLQRGAGGTPPPTRPRLFARTGADRKSPPPPARLAPLTPVATPVLSPEPAPQLWSEEAQQTPQQTLSQQQKVLLTPPRGGSGTTREGSAGVAHDADWSGHGRIEAMLPAKRERFISSADTQHSMASSSTPPPRCKRAVNDHDNNRTPTRTASHHHKHTHNHSQQQRTTELENTAASAAQLDAAGGAKAAELSARHDRLRLSNSTTSRSSSRGAISDDGSSSDLVATVAAAAMLVASSSVGGTTETATAQCLVLDDSVDSAAIVPAEQLQRMLDQAGNRGDGSDYPAEPPTPYRRRLITAEVLRDWTGWEDLELVLATQLRVDAEAMLGVEQMAQHLPRLSSLRLSGSRIPRLRQLGTGFHALKFLWLNSCHLTDLRGLAACCPALVELYASFNYIADVTPVMELSATLEVLDVEGNLLDDAGSLGFVLSSLPKVTSLSLQGNPLTCEHQSRVREAYAAAIADADVQKDEETTVAGAAAAAPLGEDARFHDVLRAWVRCLMPNLQMLNDEALQEAGEEVDAFTATTVTARAKTSATPRVSSARAVHVDPLDDRLAEELRLVAACVRETDPFDPLLEAVDAANQRVYTRPSTSCNGARPRLTPATAMGASRPSTSTRSISSSAATTTTAQTDASVLTTGAVLAGSATASLRRRLATPTPTSQEGAATGVNDSGDVHGGAARMTSTRLNDVAHRNSALHGGIGGASAETAVEEDARVAALLADDSEEDEWEHYKSALLLSSSTSMAAAGGAPDGQRSSLLSTSSAALTHESDSLASTAKAAGTALLMTEEDGFDKELKNELNRLRLRMAKAGRAE